MFNDDEWAACGMSLACASTRSSVAGYGSSVAGYGSSVAGYGSYGDALETCSYESQSSLNQRTDEHDQRKPIPPSVLAEVLARTASKSSNSTATPFILPFNEPVSCQSKSTPLTSSNFPVIPPPPPPPPPPALNPVVKVDTGLSSSLFGGPSFNLSHGSHATSGDQKGTHRPGFIYKDKGPAPQPPVSTAASCSFASSLHQDSFPEPPSSHYDSIINSNLVIPSTTASAEDFMTELESKLSLYKKDKDDKVKSSPLEKQQVNQSIFSGLDTNTLSGGLNTALTGTPTSEKKSSWIPALKPPPSISRNRSFSSSLSSTKQPKPKQMQVVPPLPSAPERESLYDLLPPTGSVIQSGFNDVTQEVETAIDSLISKVGAASRDDVRNALLRHKLDSVSALKDLQVSQLLRLGIGSRSEIETALRNSNWNLESAASRLLDTNK